MLRSVILLLGVCGLSLAQPADALGAAVPAGQAPPPRTQNGNTRKLVVRLPGKVADLRLVVALTPYRAGLPKPGLDWKDRGLDRW